MVDVCLIVEGTYPYVTGGVSAWVHQLIGSLHNLRFAVLHLSATADTLREFQYKFPPNVTYFQEIFLQDARPEALPDYKKFPGHWKDDLIAMHQRLAGGDARALEPAVNRFHSGHGPGLSLEEMLYSKPSWEMVERFYKEKAGDLSFLDYFWTWRFTHLPLFSILQQRLPDARVYHAVSTGYAGLCGALAKMRTGAPFMLTEHGIYTRERRLEIEEAEWIYRDEGGAITEERRQYFRDWWIRMFATLGRVAYQAADPIVTLCESNRAVQVAEGADPHRTRIIPNGIFPELFRDAQAAFTARDPGRPFTIGFAGRVVSIKDMKTLLRAIKIVRSAEPGVQALILGPLDEEPDYTRECQELCDILDIAPAVRFLGPVDLQRYYPQMDCLVLTSISEGQPLVILEAGCVGLPVVATDVGACRELLQGVSAEDRALGESGLVTPIANPEATAAALLRLARDPALRQRLGETGQRRVTTHYRQQDLLAEYNTLYQNLRTREAR
ncbi:MAG: GT4 family glycosyltransferase PelF [Fibrobacterota bacterium]